MKITVTRIDDDWVRLSWGGGPQIGTKLHTPKYQVSEALTEHVGSVDFTARANMYYFLVYYLGLGDNQMTRGKIGFYLHRDITPLDLVGITKRADSPGSLMSPDFADDAAIFYFLNGVLKLPKDRLTSKITHRLMREGITPKVLLRVDLSELLAGYKHLGRKSVKRLEEAIKNYRYGD